MDINVYSHCIKVTKVYTERDLQAMLAFCKPLVEMGLERKGRKFYPKALRTYAAATRDRREFSFHRNQLGDLKSHLFQRLYFKDHEISITHHTIKLGVYPKQEFRPIALHSPRENQPAIIEYVLDDGTKYPQWDAIIKMVALQTGKGKSCRANTLIRTPGSWKQAKFVKPGDYLISRDGTPTQVLAVYPQGELQLYKVTFADGRWVEVCGEHLWESYYVNTSEHARWQVRDTLEMKRLISMPNPRVYIPLIEPEELPEQTFFIDPYLMGVLIGDGCMSGERVTLSTPDKFIVDQVNWALPKGHLLQHASGCDYRINTGRDSHLLNELVDLNMLGCRAENKFIPAIYLQGSIEQRLHLMQGLMDTDGTVQKSGSLSYSTVSKELAENVQYLVRSLGGIATIHPRQTHYTHKGEKKQGQLCYEVDIRHTKPSDFVRLPRKRERINDDNQYSKDLKLRVVSIEPTEVDESICFSVDHPEKLYVVQDFIVTHNTFIAQYCMNFLGLRTVIHFKGGYVERWKEDLEKTFEFKRGELLITRGSKDLIALQHMALEGTLKAQVIIITTATMRDYIRNYEESNGRSVIYPIKPQDFYPKLGIGFRVGDEIHQEFHNNFKIDLYTHVPKSLSLSATMEASDAFKNKMYAVAYPVNQRHDGGGYDAYIAVTAYQYHLNEDTNVKYMGAQGYNHTLFEESIMARGDLLMNYFKIIERVVYNRFISVFENGQKLLIFCARVEMCTALVERLRKIYPEFNIVRYVGSLNDPYDELLESDIGVTTVGSGGTAIDLANLRVSIMTTAVDSRQSNEQVLGRTRRLKGWPDIVPEFVYFVCSDIDQHVRYDLNKREFFDGKVVSHSVERSSTKL